MKILKWINEFMFGDNVYGYGYPKRCEYCIFKSIWNKEWVCSLSKCQKDKKNTKLVFLNEPKKNNYLD